MGSSHYKLSMHWLISGLILLILTLAIYTAFWNEFMGGTDNSAVYASLFALVGASICFGISGVSFLRQARRAPPNFDSKSGKVSQSPSKVIADAFFRNRRIMILASITYALFFAVIDAIIVYQPTVDFGSNYGVSGFESSSLLSCCGPPGYVPVGLVYFPDWHAGLQIIPLSVILMVLISALVALNVSLIYSATKASRLTGANTNRGRGRKSSFGGILGTVIGLFAGCPTCAAAFFLSMLAGSGATAFSIYISQYQALIITLTVPLLLASIYFQARSTSIILQGCNV